MPQSSASKTEPPKDKALVAEDRLDLVRVGCKEMPLYMGGGKRILRKWHLPDELK